MKELTEHEALVKLTVACAKREYCLADMTEKMRRWGLDDEAQEHIKNYLIAHQYIDEERYVRAFVNDKITYNKWGRKKVAYALKQKGIEERVFTPFLEDYNATTYNEQLKHFIKAKQRTLKESDPYKAKSKLIRFALTKGYAIDEVLDVLQAITKEE